MDTLALSRLTPLKSVTVADMARISSYSSSTIRRRFKKYIQKGVIDLEQFRNTHGIGTPVSAIYSLEHLDCWYPVYPLRFEWLKRDVMLELFPGRNIIVPLSIPHYPIYPGVYYVVPDELSLFRPDFIPVSSFKRSMEATL